VRNPIHVPREEVLLESEIQYSKNKPNIERFQTYLGSESVKGSFNQVYENQFTTSNVIANTSFSQQIKSMKKISTPKEPKSEPKKARYMYGKNNSVFYA
jgi:hypothetical protein